MQLSGYTAATFGAPQKLGLEQFLFSELGGSDAGIVKVLASVVGARRSLLDSVVTVNLAITCHSVNVANELNTNAQSITQHLLANSAQWNLSDLTDATFVGNASVRLDKATKKKTNTLMWVSIGIGGAVVAGAGIALAVVYSKPTTRNGAKYLRI